MNLSGKTLNNYTFEKEIGEGGMANVYVATHNTLKQKVAIKVLNDNYVHNRNVRNRFLAEGRNMAAMSHTNVVKVFDLIDAGDVCAIVMEYIEGITLEEHILKNFPFKDVQIKRILEQMLHSLDYIHNKGFVHRDIKPSNFMITKDNVVKLLDFGIAKDSNTEYVDYTRTGIYQQMGTPIYMSPEQIESSKNVDSRSDIYSLGVVLYQLACGKKPYSFETSSLPAIQMKIIEEKLPSTQSLWDHYISKATEKNPRNRYPSAQAWLAELESKEDRTIADFSRIENPGDSRSKKIRRNTIFAIAGVFITLTVLFFLIPNCLYNTSNNSSLNSFVLVEEGLQIAVENEFARGQEKYFDLKEISIDNTCPELRNKASQLMDAVDQIDQIASNNIKWIDDLKLELLSAAGEDIHSIGIPESIIVKAYDSKGPLKPTRMNLNNVQQKSEAVSMKKSQNLWTNFNQFRKELTELVASSQLNGSFYFNAPDINEYNDYQDLYEQLENAINSSNVALDDKDAIKKIYASLTKPAEIEGQPYFDYTFNGVSLVGAIGILTSLQKEILTARADAIALIRSRVGRC